MYTLTQVQQSRGPFLVVGGDVLCLVPAHFQEGPFNETQLPGLCHGDTMFRGLGREELTRTVLGW